MTIVLALFLTLAAPPAGEPAPPSPEEVAEEAAQRALTLYQKGRIVEAAQHFARAYRLSGHPTQLRNAAKAFEVSGWLEDALELWKEYAGLALSPDKVEEARARIAAIEAKLLALDKARPRPRPPPPPVEPPIVTAPIAPEAPAEDHFVARWTVAGLGAASIVAGVVLYFTGWSTYWAYRDQDPARPEISRLDADAAELRSGIGIALGAAGALAVTAAFVLLAD